MVLSERCSGIKKNGERCSFKAKLYGFCGMHKNQTTRTSQSSHTPKQSTSLCDKKWIIEDCAVCTDPVKKNPQLSCGHKIHRKCIIKDAKIQNRQQAICPVCRREFPEIWRNDRWKPSEPPLPSMNELLHIMNDMEENTNAHDVENVENVENVLITQYFPDGTIIQYYPDSERISFVRTGPDADQIMNIMGLVSEMLYAIPENN